MNGLNKFRFYLMMIVLIIGGACLMVYGIKTSSSMSKDPIDLNDPDVDWSDIEVGDHVEMDLPILLDCFARYEKDGKDTQRYYCIPRYEEDELSITDFIGVEVKDQSLFSSYDDLVEDSWNWWNSADTSLPSSSTVHIDGVVRELPSEQLKFFEEYLRDDLELNDDLVDDSQYKLYITPETSKGSAGLTIVGAIMLVAGLGITGFSLTRRRG